MVWYGMVWYGMVWYGMVWYGMVWYGMVWYGRVYRIAKLGCKKPWPKVDALHPPGQRAARLFPFRASGQLLHVEEFSLLEFVFMFRYLASQNLSQNVPSMYFGNRIL